MRFTGDYSNIGFQTKCLKPIPPPLPLKKIFLKVDANVKVRN